MCARYMCTFKFLNVTFRCRNTVFLLTKIIFYIRFFVILIGMANVVHALISKAEQSLACA